MPDAHALSTDGSDDDDLDFIVRCKNVAVPKKRKERLPSVSDEEDEVEEEEEESLRDKKTLKTVRTVKHEHGTGERVLMTDDEDDDAYIEWKRKMTEDGKRKRTVVKASRLGGLGANIKKNPVEQKVPEKKIRGEDDLSLPWLYLVPVLCFPVHKKRKK